VRTFDLLLLGGFGFGSLRLSLSFRGSGFRGVGRSGFAAFGSHGVGAGEIVAFFGGDGDEGTDLDSLGSIGDLVVTRGMIVIVS
jgi:hypothetical protein